ncbi:DUF1569 domain-containing protein [Shewanella algicola]|uniref:DUF1569 domain-containing protein n=1 Tax=Shewanella algicola TaxID=640633 RepID=UPI00249413B2|nr:DUF1569 domain-containing protein [Shewanella algicola]
MQRRQFIKLGLIGATAGVTGASAVWLSQGKNPSLLNLNSLQAKLNVMLALPSEQLASLSTGDWNSAQVFSHCAQSVEFSMSGFPQHKSAVFKHSVGALAFAAFATKGAMTHSLSEAIPAAPALDPNVDVKQALTRLLNSVTDFEQYQGPLAPHFAYGELNKADYELAHVLHFYNHLDTFNAFS